MSKNIKKAKALKIIRIALICVFATVFVVSAVMLINTVHQYGEAEDLYKELAEKFFEEVNKTTGMGSDTTATVIWSRGEDTSLPEPVDTGVVTIPDTGNAVTTSEDKPVTTTETPVTTAPPEPVLSERFVNVCNEIKKLQAINSDVVGYILIQFEEKEYISYPVCRNDDNLYYTTHAYNNTELKSGSIFLDSRCKPVISENTASLIFGHNMNDGSMFAKLTKFKTTEYFNNVNITIFTLEGIYTYKVFSVHNADADDDYTNIYFDTDTEYLAFLQKMQNASYIKSNLKLYPSDQIITLSTCLNTTLDARLAVHAVLVSIER